MAGNLNNIQLSLDGEVNSGADIYRETRSVKVYIKRWSPTLKGIVVLVFTKSFGRIILQKSNFL